MENRHSYIVDHKSPDPLGQALLDYMAGHERAKIRVYSNVADEEFLPAKVLMRKWGQMPKQERIALEHCRGEVLDIGAGAGSHALVLQERGLDVTAIDVSAGAVDVMKKRGFEKAYLADFWQWEGQYDTLLLLMNGIGMVGTIEGFRAFLKKAQTLLKEGGQIIFDSSDLVYLFEREDGKLDLPPNETYYGEVQYQMTYKKHIGEHFNWLFIDSQKMEKEADNQGFSSQILFTGPHYEYLVRLVK